MVGKVAAAGKKRGRPRKKSKGRPPLSPPPASAASRREAPPLPPPPQPPARRSGRPRRPRRMDDYADYNDYEEEDDFYHEELFTDEEATKEEEEDEEEEAGEGAERRRREKKFKLLQKLPNHHQHYPAAIDGAASSSSSSEDDDGAGGRGALEKGRGGGGLRPGGSGSGSEGEEDGRGHGGSPKSNRSSSGRVMEHCAVSTLLPDRKILEAVLDKLQKKDIYGVYAEPVDPEELPDYHDIIKHPMDFGTIRKNLTAKARSIQELARKKFQRIRFDSEDALRSEQKTQSSSITKKIRKRSLCKSACNPAASEISLVATCISAGVACGSEHNAEQPCPAEQPVSVDGFVDDSLTCENKSEKGEEHSAKSSPVKLERKPDLVYEDRRTTYDALDEQTVVASDSPFSMLEDEQKHLVAVGIDAQYSYARSLARFAGTLGPIAWRIASEKIEKALPAGIKFGPGWVGEYEPLPTPVLSFESQSGISGYSTHFLCKAENLKKAKKDEMKYAKSATKSLHSDTRVPSDSSVTGVSNEKKNHIKEISFCHGSVEQNPRLIGFNNGPRPMIPNATLLQYRPSLLASAKDYKTKVGTNFSSSKIESVGNMAAQRSEWCSEVTASTVPERVSGSRNNKQSETFKQPELVSHQSESVSSSSDNKGLSGGKDVENFGGSGRQSVFSGFISPNQSRVLSGYFGHGGHEEAAGDPTDLIRIMPCRKTVEESPKELMSTVPLPRNNSVAAAPAATPAWMSIGRSSKQKMTQVPDHLKMQDGAVPLGNLSSGYLTSVSGFHENNQNRANRPTLSVSQLPTQAVSEEFGVQRKGLTTFPQFIATELSRSHGQTPWQSLAPHLQRQQEGMRPPDLNVTFRSPRSPVRQSSGILVDSQQPDLALQL